MNSVDAIKELREQTSCGIIDCKNALEEAKGDFEKAKTILQKRGLEIAAKKGSRTAREGRVEGYVHNGNKIGVLVEVNCETDFVARSDDFARFSKDLAMHIAAMAPDYIREDEVPGDVLSDQKDKKTFLKEKVLLNQPFVKDQSKSVQDCLNELVAKIGENTFVSRFTRYKLGQH